ncbi:MAG: hypothetical protein ACFCVF_02280 [Kineosporiaceae bacterium]
MTLPDAVPTLPVPHPRPVLMSGFDPRARDLLWSAARALEVDADEVRALAATVARSAGLDWRGAAAESFRSAVAERAGAVRRAAVLIDDLAVALRTAAAGTSW